MPVKLNEERKDNTTKISGVVQRDNGLCFANTLEDFIDCYNNYYKDKGEVYVQPYSEWYSQGFYSDNPPSDLYYRDGVGIYPYFAYGESVRMCIIPMTKKVIKVYKKKGVKIHKF